MVGGDDEINLALQELEESFDVEAVTSWRERREIFFREAKEADGGKHPAAIFRMRWTGKLLLQMHKAARRLDESFEIIRVLRFRPQPEMLEDVVRFVVALLVPAEEKSAVTGMLGDFVRRGISWRAAQLFDQPGNSLVFVHGTLSFRLAEMTGNRAGGFFAMQKRARAPGGP